MVEFCGKCFLAIKTEITATPILAYPVLGKPYLLHCDASSKAIEAVLSQVDDNGDERFIPYISFQFNATQRNRPIIEKVAFAIIYAIQCLRTYLYRATFTVFTDHKTLKFLFQSKTVKNPKFQRWGPPAV